jgi:hypothetical protein
MVALSVPLKVPVGQGLHIGRMVVPPGTTNEPALHAHVLSCCAVPAAVCVVPAGHGLNGVHAVTLPPVLKVPAGHALQSSSIVALPAAKRYVPAPHGVNGVHAGALVAVL